MKLKPWLIGVTAVSAMAVTSAPTAHADVVKYEMVTNEISAIQKDGSKVEVYRFDPGVVAVQQGDDVTLRIRGVKGHDHPIVLEGYGLQAVVHRNEVTTLHFQANRPGVFQLICTAHADEKHSGPMIGYILVVPKNK